MTDTEAQPVAWMYVNDDGECEQIDYGPACPNEDFTPLVSADTLARLQRERDQAVEALQAADDVFMELHGGINAWRPRLPAIDRVWRIARATLASIGEAT